MDEIKNISALSFTGGNNRPGPFAPSHAVLATGPLGDMTVNYQIPHRPFRTIIGRLDVWIGQKYEVIVRQFAPKPFFQFTGQFMIRRTSNLLQESLFYSLHPPLKTLRGVVGSLMQGLEQFFHPSQQFLAPTGQNDVRLVGQKTNLTNQMSHTVL